MCINKVFTPAYVNERNRRRETDEDPFTSFVSVICSFSVSARRATPLSGANATLTDDVAQTNTQTNWEKRIFFPPLLLTLHYATLWPRCYLLVRKVAMFSRWKRAFPRVCVTPCVLSWSATRHSNLYITVYLHSYSRREGGHMSSVRSTICWGTPSSNLLQAVLITLICCRKRWFKIKLGSHKEGKHIDEDKQQKI